LDCFEVEKVNQIACKQSRSSLSRGRWSRPSVQYVDNVYPQSFEYRTFHHCGVGKSRLQGKPETCSDFVLIDEKNPRMHRFHGFVSSGSDLNVYLSPIGRPKRVRTKIKLVRHLDLVCQTVRESRIWAIDFEIGSNKEIRECGIAMWDFVTGLISVRHFLVDQKFSVVDSLFCNTETVTIVGLKEELALLGNRKFLVFDSRLERSILQSLGLDFVVVDLQLYFMDADKKLSLASSLIDEEIVPVGIHNASNDAYYIIKLALVLREIGVRVEDWFSPGDKGGFSSD